MKQSLGLYIHIPFCLKKCSYCDFCSFPGSSDDRMVAYTQELCQRLTQAAPRTAEYRVDTVYFGGGTPTLLPLPCFASLMNTIRTHYALSADSEITCECNPATADEKKLRTLRELGINRLSIGLQSVHDDELALLGRAHSFSDFVTVLSDARRAGFDNVSADLMYGIPSQTLESFSQTLDTLIALSPEHISAYGLKIEDGTPFATQYDRLTLPDEDTEVAMYRLCIERLTKNGYRQYEISNFAKSDHESRHNLRYWLGLDYLGFGVAAHSCFGGERFGNSRDLAAFLAGKDVIGERSILNAQDRLIEYVMLRLRLTEGIDCTDFAACFGVPIEEMFPVLPRLITQKFLQKKDGRISFTTKGFLVSNAILAELLTFD